MAGALRKTMEYLGLAEVDDYGAEPARDERAQRGRAVGPDDGYDDHGDDAGEWGGVDDQDHRIGDGDDAGRPRGHGSTALGAAEARTGYGRVTTLPTRASLAAAPDPRGDHRTQHHAGRSADDVAELRRITTIHPRTYNEAKSIGESFRAGIPVIMNLTDMTDPDAKRLVDFSAGLVFGLRGSIERVTNKVFLLSPEHVTVSSEAPAARVPHPFNQS